MFTKVLEWLRGVLDKMLSTNNVQKALKVDIEVSSLMAEAILLWSSMYENKAPWLVNGVKSLNLPAAIASEIARLTTIEMKAEVSGSPRAEFLNNQLKSVVSNMRDQLEYGVAKGGMVLKPYVDLVSKKVVVDFIQADQFFPVSFDSDGNMTACVFVDQRKIGRYYYTRLEYHSLDGTVYTVRNSAYKSDTENTLGFEVSLDVVPDWAGLEEESKMVNIKQPLFAYYRYPMSNMIDSKSPLGVSAYSRARDLIEQADKQWTEFLWEFESGSRRMYVDTLAFGKDETGKPVLPVSKLYRTLDMAGSEIGKGKLFDEWSPTLREENLLNGLDAILKRIEFNVGLAYGTLSDPQNVDKTATEVLSSKQRSASTVMDCQKEMKQTIDNLLYAMDVWATLYKLAPRGAYSVGYEFDDSLVNDPDKVFTHSSSAVGMRVMSKLEFRMIVYGETEEQARKMLALVDEEIAKEPNPVDSLF